MTLLCIVDTNEALKEVVGEITSTILRINVYLPSQTGNRTREEMEESDVKEIITTVRIIEETDAMEIIIVIITIIIIETIMIHEK